MFLHPLVTRVKPTNVLGEAGSTVLRSQRRQPAIYEQEGNLGKEGSRTVFAGCIPCTCALRYGQSIFHS